jgi:hypothetical protein
MPKRSKTVDGLGDPSVPWSLISKRRQRLEQWSHARWVAQDSPPIRVEHMVPTGLREPSTDVGERTQYLRKLFRLDEMTAIRRR